MATSKETVVLTKGNRTLVVQHPTKKQLKSYKRKDWVLNGAISEENIGKLREVLAANQTPVPAKV